jgi:hypothetical protein
MFLPMFEVHYQRLSGTIEWLLKTSLSMTRDAAVSHKWISVCLVSSAFHAAGIFVVLLSSYGAVLSRRHYA